MFRFIKGVFNTIFGFIGLVLCIACGGLVVTSGGLAEAAVFLIFSVCLFLFGVGCLASAYENFSGKKLK